ncbi:SDR family oxidoreductase [Nocardioides terrisoli]|uniref:SDR family oxidoreductase n=1 Tax=Nocardioides terrisoli TaxID=3388267 RepID=UPI00287BA23E|nr:SDR family oxidoreductase [Nocardioides marmorisolisilvae]
MGLVTIIGGHGQVALLTAPLLVADGHRVRSVIRNPAQADDVRRTGAEPVVADVETMTVEDLAALIEGSDALVWSAGAGGGDPDRTRAVDRDAAVRSISAAGAAGVDRYVMVSYFGAGPDHGVPPEDPFFTYAEAKAAADERLRASSLAWTVLGPSRLTDDPGTGRIELGTDPGVGGGSVSRADVAAVVAAVVSRPRTTGRTIEFNNGPRPIPEALGAPV